MTILTTKTKKITEGSASVLPVTRYDPVSFTSFSYSTSLGSRNKNLILLFQPGICY